MSFTVMSYPVNPTSLTLIAGSLLRSLLFKALELLITLPNFAKDLYFQSTRPATLKALKSAALGGFFVLSVSYELEWQSLLYNEQHI